MERSRSSVRFVDLRPASDFRHERIPGAVSLTEGLSRQEWGKLKDAEVLILYDSETGLVPGDCLSTNPEERLATARKILQGRGIVDSRVKFLPNGWAEWKSRGLPVESGSRGELKASNE